MHFYSRPSLPRSYLPQSFNHPATYYLDDEPSFAFAFDHLAYSPSSLPVPPKIDTETRYGRYGRALRELKAAEQEFRAYIALENARQAALVRQRSAAEVARRERKLALQAEIQHIMSTREFCAPTGRSKTGLHNTRARSSALS